MLRSAKSATSTAMYVLVAARRHRLFALQLYRMLRLAAGPGSSAQDDTFVHQGAAWSAASAPQSLGGFSLMTNIGLRE